jgi:hypothetical protein
VETKFGKAMYRSPTRSEIAAVSSEMSLEVMEKVEEGKKGPYICHHMEPHHT